MVGVRERVPMNAEGAAFVAAARMFAEELLDELPERLRHCRFVAVRAAKLCPAVAASKEALLVAAAWLHDIGYATALRKTGFHPLDGPTTSPTSGPRRNWQPWWRTIRVPGSSPKSGAFRNR